MLHSFHYTVIGRVQGLVYFQGDHYLLWPGFDFAALPGVFFRVFLKNKAQELGVVGYVKNDRTGDVSGVAQGEQTALDKFKDSLSKGPKHAVVAQVKLTQEKQVDEPEYPGFDIIR